MLLSLEILGTLAFAISGAMVAVHKKMDMLGVVILGVTTAIGGGIIRDLILGITPPKSLTDPLYAAISAGVSLIVFIPFIRRKINVDHIAFVIVDALGLGTFTVVGMEAANGLDNPFLQIFLGVLTGVGGGVLRDVFANEEPVIFVKRFYATASLVGAIGCELLYPIGREFAMVSGIVAVVVLRVLAAVYKWNLPRAE